MKRTYDSTVARIAGNIASGLIPQNDVEAVSIYKSTGPLVEMIESVAILSVALARAIVAEVERTEPTASTKTFHPDHNGECTHCDEPGDAHLCPPESLP